MVGVLLLNDPNEPESKKNLWYVGILISILSSLCSALGVNFQKIAHNKKIANPEIKLLCSFFWWLGMINLVLSSVFDVVSYMFAAMSILAPLAAASLLFNIILARVLLKEHIS